MADQLPPDQKAGLHEESNRPHNINHLRRMYEEFKLDPAIIYLYSILAYVNCHVAGNQDFFHGEFTDVRREDDIMQGRDPFYAMPVSEDYNTENGPYIWPWMTPLSRLGNHQSVIIYDARRHHIWIVDQQWWRSTDPALVDGRVIYPDD